MEYSDISRRGAIAHLCNHKCLKDREVERFLTWLFDHQLQDSNFRVSYSQIYNDFMLRGRTAAKQINPDEIKGQVSNFLEKVRHHIERCYRDDGDLRSSKPDLALPYVDIPTGIKKSSEGGGITLQFLSTRPVPMKERRAAKQNRKPSLKPEDDPTWRLWRDLLRPVKGDGRVVYSDEQPELREALKEEFAETLDGKYSGSCEPAATFLIGQCIAHQHISFSTVRSKIMAKSMGEEKRKKLLLWKALIFLGSPVINRVLKRIREEHPWRDRQTFHFEVDERGATVLYKGPLGSHGQRWGSSAWTEYALVSYFKSNDQVLIAFAGNRSIGTWAAAKALCDRDWVAQFVQHMKFSEGKPIPSFEAVLKVQIDENILDTFEVVDHTIHAD